MCVCPHVHSCYGCSGQGSARQKPAAWNSVFPVGGEGPKHLGLRRINRELHWRGKHQGHEPATMWVPSMAGSSVYPLATHPPITQDGSGGGGDLPYAGSLPSCLQQPRLSPVLHPDLPCGCQGPTWTIRWYLPRCISRELDQTWSSWDLNQYRAVLQCRMLVLQVAASLGAPAPRHRSLIQFFHELLEAPAYVYFHVLLCNSYLIKVSLFPTSPKQVRFY